MWNYSSSIKKYSGALQWVKTNVIYGKTKYTMAILIALLIAIPMTVYATTPPKAPAKTAVNPLEHQEVKTSEQTKPVAAKEETSEDMKTDVQATINNAAGQSQAQLELNNQPVAVPNNGTVHQVVQNDGSGQTTVNISSSSSSEGSSTTKSKTKIKVKSSSTSEVDFNSSE